MFFTANNFLPATRSLPMYFFFPNYSVRSRLSFSFAAPIPPVIVPPGDFPRPELVVNCLANGVGVEIKMTDKNFHGVMYVKGHSNDPRCRRAVEPGESREIINFNVDFDTCGLFHFQVSLSSARIQCSELKTIILRLKSFF